MLSKPELSGRSAIIPVTDVITQAAAAMAADRRPGQAAPGLEDGPRLTVAASSGARSQHADEIAGHATAEPMIQPAAERAEGNAVSWTVDIILAYLARNSVDSQALPKLIADLHGVLEQISTPEQRAPETGPRPAVPVGLSVTPDYIVCLEDGRRFKSMKRYLKSAYSLTPEEYREKWGLPASYPMIAPGYAALCSARAKSQKLGRRPAG
ncbi:MucR family transcriptional regulator [Inquilinus sp.]|uniref:MucR family transcriptional regulator n=1 Tax=Inquilinus sp. TaxID=1932117 RepID=UPI00378482AF